MQKESVPTLIQELSNRDYYKNRSISESQLVSQFEKLVGKDLVGLVKQVEHLRKKLKINNQGNDEILVNAISLLKPQEESRDNFSKKFQDSQQGFTTKLGNQHSLINLFHTRPNNGDYELKETFDISRKDLTPSSQLIQEYRGDVPHAPIADEVAIQSAQNYIQKYRDYLLFIDSIQNAKHVPSEPEKALVLENFAKYLENARYYLEFVSKYSKLWSIEPSKEIVPYRGLWIPIEKRKKLFDFDNPGESFEMFRSLGESQTQMTPELAMYFSNSTFVPPMKRNELKSLYFPLSSRMESNGQGKSISIGIENNEGIFETDGNSQKTVQKTEMFNEGMQEGMTQYLSRSHFKSAFEQANFHFYQQGGINSVSPSTLLNNAFKIAEYYRNSSIQMIILCHSSSNLSIMNPDFLVVYIAFSCLIGIPVLLTFGESTLSELSRYHWKNTLLATSDQSLIPIRGKVLFYGHDTNEEFAPSQRNSQRQNSSIDNYFEILKQSKTMNIDSSDKFPRKSTPNRSIVANVGTKTVAIGADLIERLIVVLEKSILPCTTILVIGIGTNHPLSIPLSYFLLKHKIVARFISKISEIDNTMSCQLIIGNPHDINQLKRMESSPKIASYFGSRLLLSIQALLKHSPRYLSIGKKGTLDVWKIFNDGKFCEIEPRSNTISVSRNDKEIHISLKNEISFYQKILKTLTLNRQTGGHTVESDPAMEVFFKEIDHFSKSLDRDDLIQYVEKRLGCAIATLDALPIETVSEVTESVEIKILEGISVKEGPGLINDDIGLILEEIGDIHRVYVDLNNPIRIILSRKVSKGEWERILRVFRTYRKDIAIPDWKDVKYVENLLDYDVFDEEGEFVKEKVDLRFFFPKSRL